MHTPGAAIDFTYIGRIALILVGLYVLSFIFSYIQVIYVRYRDEITYMFRRNISEKIKRMPLKYFDTKTHGEVLSRVTNDVDTISTSLAQNLSQIVTSVTRLSRHDNDADNKLGIDTCWRWSPCRCPSHWSAW